MPIYRAINVSRQSIACIEFHRDHWCGCVLAQLKRSDSRGCMQSHGLRSPFREGKGFQVSRWQCLSTAPLSIHGKSEANSSASSTVAPIGATLTDGHMHAPLPAAFCSFSRSNKPCYGIVMLVGPHWATCCSVRIAESVQHHNPCGLCEVTSLPVSLYQASAAPNLSANGKFVGVQLSAVLRPLCWCEVLIVYLASAGFLRSLQP